MYKGCSQIRKKIKIYIIYLFVIGLLILLYYLPLVLSFCIFFTIFHRFPTFNPMSFKISCNSLTDVFIKRLSSIPFSSNIHELSSISSSDRNVSIVIFSIADTKRAFKKYKKVHVIKQEAHGSHRSPEQQYA